MPITILVVPPFSTLCNAAFALRREVFVWEQKVPEAEEHDADDMTATHFVAVAEGEVVGTLRLIDKPEHVKIGRVAVRQSFRGHGIAKRMILAAMEHARTEGRERFTLPRNRTSWACMNGSALPPSVRNFRMAACRTAPCAAMTARPRS